MHACDGAVYFYSMAEHKQILIMWNNSIVTRTQSQTEWARATTGTPHSDSPM